MTTIINIILSVILAAAPQTKAAGGTAITIDNLVTIDKTTHDFGDVMTTDGPLTCSFNVTNVSGKPLAITNVVSSCGCTDVKWTREPLLNGKTGKIQATYKNEDGPYPFSKNLTVYVSGCKKPIILTLRGVVHEKQKPLSELYPVHIGNLGFKSDDIKCGNMTQGSQRSDAIAIANLGKTAVKIGFADVSDYLKVSVEPNPLPAGAVGKVTYTISSSRERWGKNYYYFTPVIDGRKTSGKIGVWAYTKDDFSSLTSAQKASGPMPMFSESTFTFGKVKAGTIVKASFSLKNNGKETFHIYKADFDRPGGKVISMNDVEPGKSGNVTISLDTTSLPAGEGSVLVTLTTNSPSRPIINLYLAGCIQ